MLVTAHCRSAAAAVSVSPDFIVYLISIVVYGHMVTITAVHSSSCMESACQSLHYCFMFQHLRSAIPPVMLKFALALPSPLLSERSSHSSISPVYTCHLVVYSPSAFSDHVLPIFNRFPDCCALCKNIELLIIELHSDSTPTISICCARPRSLARRRSSCLLLDFQLALTRIRMKIAVVHLQKQWLSHVA